MKIGIVTEYYYPTLGGIHEHVHHFAVAARASGHEVSILTPNVEDRLASVAEHDRVLRVYKEMLVPGAPAARRRPGQAGEAHRPS